MPLPPLPESSNKSSNKFIIIFLGLILLSLIAFNWNFFRNYINRLTSSTEKIYPNTPNTSSNTPKSPLNTPIKTNFSPPQQQKENNDIQSQKTNFWEQTAPINEETDMDKLQKKIIDESIAIDLPQDLISIINHPDFLINFVNMINDLADDQFKINSFFFNQFSGLKSSFKPQKQGSLYIPHNIPETASIQTILKWFCEDVSAKQLTELYLNIEPQLAQIYNLEVQPDKNFRQRFYKAITKIQKYHFPSTLPTLTFQQNKFIFVDKNFEELSLTEKFIFRRGKYTLDRVQKKISVILQDISTKQ